MLFDQVFEYCENEFERFDVCATCSHPSGVCSGNCQTCLDEVHFQSTTDGKRADYECEKLLLCYVQRYALRYKNNICAAVEGIGLDRYPCFDILSIGCGAAPDLMAFEGFAGEKEVFYLGYDRNTRWENIHDYIEDCTGHIDNISATFRRRDIFEILAEGRPRGRSFNVIVVQFLISHLFNTGQNGRIDELYTGLIRNVVSHRNAASPFLIIINDIDTYHKGRNLFYKLLDALEDSGYNGTAIAYSNYANGDLGKTRWGGNKKRLGSLDYSYAPPPAGFEGAGLIIELNGGEDT